MALDKYSPARMEEKWYRHWMANNRFQPTFHPDKDAFCIVIPPPNVTGSLHMGHAWDNTLQDILIRWKRMQGLNTLWIPGFDHASIATQWMVERLVRERGLTKEQMGREAFLEETRQFAEDSKATITGQLQRLGVSCDWSRTRYTLDDGLSHAVRRVFVTLHREGLIYRANRMVSWCPRCQTAISDLEVNHTDREGGLWHIRYPLADGSGFVTVATTRPETMLGDAAVAVHPQDPRYTSLIGKQVRLPLVDKLIPLVADDYVDLEFGTGAVKITPAHDPNDFEMGKRHNLEVVNILNQDGTLNQSVPQPYRGLDRFEARKRVVADLDGLGLLEKTDKHRHAVGACSRCSTVVEPMVSLQWYVNVKQMAQDAVRAVESKTIELLPDYQEKIFYEWMNNIQDWCISRQLWWGHRIPVWYCHPCQTEVVAEQAPTACPSCGGPVEQDKDVLDTWFSSGLWPFSTMGWPDEESRELKTFYPTAVLVTGYDILFFWVARMAMMGLKFMGQVPFHQVFLHGLLRDKHGEKMSKTKGNGIDPLEVIDQYGADALRFTLAAQTAMGRDMVLQEATIVGYRNFINKIWNAARFYLGHVDSLGAPAPLEGLAGLGLFDRWILGRCQETAREVNRLMELRRFNESAKELYQFVWGELCDWYIEISKPVLLGDQGADAARRTLAVLHQVLGDSLKLLHPLMPFVTEELWHHLSQADGQPRPAGDLMVQLYPMGKEDWVDPPALTKAARVIAVVDALRTLRGEYQVKPRQQLDAAVAADTELQAMLESERTTITTLAGLKQVEFVSTMNSREGYATGVGAGFEVFVSLAALIDVEAERVRLTREMGKTREKLDKLEAKLHNPAYIEKAPENVIQKNREEMASLQAQMTTMRQGLDQLPSH